MFEVRYLPLAKKDLSNIALYIADHLKASQAAIDLVDALDSSITRLKQFPYSCKVYQTIKELEDEYRILPVNNYLVLYVVIDEVVEIRRIVYAKVDLEKLIRHF